MPVESIQDLFEKHPKEQRISKVIFQNVRYICCIHIKDMLIYYKNTVKCNYLNTRLSVN